jgi:hypothetical protein
MRRLAAVAALALLAWGCDSGPKGSGEYVGSIQTPGPVLGGAVLEVVGKGIEGFSGSGGSRVFWAARPDLQDGYRVIVLHASPSGEIQFRVSVQDLAEGRPLASIVNLVGVDDLTLPATPEYRVRFRR